MLLQHKTILGAREYVSFPELNLHGLLAKTDTGAKTSSLHALNVETKDTEVSFDVETTLGERQRVTLPLIKERIVISSNGHKEQRCVIETYFVLANGEKHKCQLTLRDRTTMRCPVLLGQRLLARNFLIDPSAEFLLGQMDSGK